MATILPRYHALEGNYFLFSPPSELGNHKIDLTTWQERMALKHAAFRTCKLPLRLATFVRTGVYWLYFTEARASRQGSGASLPPSTTALIRLTPADEDFSDAIENFPICFECVT